MDEKALWEKENLMNTGLKAAAKKHQEHIQNLQKIVSSLVEECVCRVSNEIPDEALVEDAGYIFTGVSVGLLATYMASLLKDKAASKEFVFEKIKANWSYWYDITIKSIVKQMEDQHDKSDADKKP